MKVNLVSIKRGKNKYHLIFSGYVHALDSNTKFLFDFIGTEVITTAGLLEDQKEHLKQALLSDFGPSPFNFADAKRIFDSYKQYEV